MHSSVAGDVQHIGTADAIEMSDEVVLMLRNVRDAFHRLDPAPLKETERLGRVVHGQEHAATARVTARSPLQGLNAVDEEEVFVPMHLARMADNIGKLAGATGRMIREGILFTDRANHEALELFDAAIELLEGLRDAERTGNRTLVRYVLDAGRSCETRANEYARFHEQRLVEGVCLPRASSVYLAMLEQLKGVEWHARQIARTVRPEQLGG
jgi:Na+/phosphate symporter